MAEYRIWHSASGFADYIIDKTILRHRECIKKQLYESDASKPREFFTVPDHIKKILYLDAPDIIVECNQEPLFSIEISTEAGTGHNAFQRFARQAAAVENGVPAIYIYPEAAIIERKARNPKSEPSLKWDCINPMIFRAMDDVMNIYGIPALLFYYPSDYRDFCANPSESPNILSKGLRNESVLSFAASPDGSDMQMSKMFSVLNIIIESFEKEGVSSRLKLLSKREFIDHRRWMQEEAVSKSISSQMSPLTATIEVPTEYLLNYLSAYEDEDYRLGDLLRSRKTTLLYKVNASFRGDPYPGALAAIDYLKCREGRTFEDRKMNLVLCWGNVDVDDENKTLIISSDKEGCSINSFIRQVKNCNSKNLLTKDYSQLKGFEIPRYYMQVRYGSMFSKAKHIRVYSYFADAILFKDGALWRDA